VDRYGEFVLYKPRLQKSTIVLWGLPILLLFLGAGVVWLITKRKKGVSQSGKNSDDDGVGNTLNSEERQTLERLLNKESPRHPSKKTTHQTIQHEESQ
jgi:cytochrome c-type biogenesis protein CcmH